MHAEDTIETADKKNNYSRDEDYLDDRVLDGIFMDLTEQSANGEYSYDYDKTAGLTPKDLRYCKEKLEDLGYSVSVDYEKGVISIDW